ncbi:MAG: sigma 54-interacting transcriptional regulator [Pseudomonadota bacterium]
MQDSPTDVLLVDDDPDLLQLISLRLRRNGYSVRTASGGEEALAFLSAQRPRLVITDLKMRGMDGMALFEAIRARSPVLPVIILTAHGTIPDAVDAAQRGVFGYLTKPFDDSTLLRQVASALQLSAPASVAPAAEWRRDIITCSPAVEELLRQAGLVAAGDASVLIQGASGTGKELFAHAIHRASPRAAKPFVAINCAALPEQLLESELFGHKKGAFTGAAQDHKGLFQAANGGTLFLDEIGDMPLSLQAKLLRALQERQVRPVGAAESVPIDVRIISATHRKLEERLAEGSFREDLYYRLNVVTLRLPPLSERREDIPLLCAHFLKELASRYKKDLRGFAPEAMELLVQAAWPGNVRQLQNVVEQCAALATVPVIPAALVQNAINADPGGLQSLEEARRGFERDYLVRVLKITAGNVTQAARLAGRNRTEFYKLLDRHGLTPSAFKPAKD